MASRYLLIALCFISLSGANAQLFTVNGKVKITVGTTSACSDTLMFITGQLVDAYARYKNFLEIEFVPWGRTIRNPDNSLTCQFGTADCLANRIHRCALHLLNGNQDAQVQYMACEFTPPYPALNAGSYNCALAAGVSYNDIYSCVTDYGYILDIGAEIKAREPMAIINFVPSIHFNDIINVSVHNLARSNLQSVICAALATDPSSGINAATC